ncbi:hypothetical protein BJX66DRAFT_305161 [Aspergillus keveii]|uniref:BZIP transcription factor n=1 Tax=Aspergillus keveii TaxID=714993 RepID=A0ABR4G4M7_9EURO
MNENLSSKRTPSFRASQSNHSLHSDNVLTRKRERDKENQRRKREREREYIAGLESIINDLEQKLEDAVFHRYRSKATSNSQSPALDSRSASDSRCHSRDKPENHLAVASLSPTNGIETALSLCEPSVAPVFPGDSPPTQSCSPDDSVVVSIAVLRKLFAAPEWARAPSWNLARPSPNYRFLRRGEAFAPLSAHLRADPGMEAACPPYPKVLDLFFGGSSNLLANFVHSEISGLPLLPPEKFASMYIIYLYLRWLVWPSEDNFLRFPEQYRPTMLQLVQDHHLSFDLLPWPQMRDNFIRHRSEYDLKHVLGLFCCMFRIRGCSGSDFITRTNDGEPQAKDDFIRRTMDSSCWCLLEEFWIEYPELVENLDLGLMLQRDSLVL